MTSFFSEVLHSAEGAINRVVTGAHWTTPAAVRMALGPESAMTYKASLPEV